MELMVVVLLGLVIRVLAGRNSITSNGILINGYDDYYHMRRILYTIDHFPHVLWFDSYLNYPKGLEITWPPLFDQIAAFLSIALGQQSRSGAEVVTASVLPILVASAVIILVYWLVKELFDGKTALLAAFLTAIAPYFVQKTMIGSADHHGFEVLMALTTFFFLILALDRNKKRFVYSGTAGLTMAGFAYTWLGVAIYFVIILIYVVAQVTWDLKRNYSSAMTSRVILTMFGVSLALIVPNWDASWMQISFFSLVACIICILILFALKLLFINRKLHWPLFPVISGMLFAILFLASQLLDLIPGSFRLNKLAQIYLYLLGGEMGGLISEAQNTLLSPEILLSRYIFFSLEWALLLSLAGLVALTYYMLKIEAPKKNGLLLLLVLSISTLILTWGQIRFLYFFNVIMCILISIFFVQVLEFAEEKQLLRNGFKKDAFFFVFLIILVLPFASGVFALSNENPPIVGDWYETLEWMKNNTNSTSWFEDPSHKPEYGIMSWWDYGNWIVYQGLRPVVANNFQVGISDSIRFFFSNNESLAMATMDARGSRYVVTDYDMLYSKLSAMALWAKEDPSSYLLVKDFSSYVVAEPTEKLLETTMAQLHFRDAAGMGHFRLIYESPNTVGRNHPYNKVKLFEYVPGAMIKIQSDSFQAVGIVLNMTTNQGRFFQYFNVGIPMQNTYEIRVPYSTEPRYETKAMNPYMIFLKNSEGVWIQEINISEKDILEGRTLYLDF